MTLRLRYHLLFVSLFAALALGNVALFRSIERAETAWGLAEQSKGYAICLAVFLGREKALTPEVLERLQPALLRLSTTGALGLQYFPLNDSDRSAVPLLVRSDLPAPPPPGADVLAELARLPAASRFLATPAADHDLNYGYAAIRSTGGELRAVVGVAARDTVMRTRMLEVWHTSAVFCALALVTGLAAAESLTRFTRRSIARLESDATALAHGEYSSSWEPIRVAELNDLGNTLQSIADILQEGIRQTRRRFVQAELLPRQEDTAADCQDLCDAAPPPTGAGPHVIVRRINRGFPEDFWGVRTGASGWCVAAGRLAAPPQETDLLERVVRANSARDFVLGSCLSAAPPPDPWLQLSVVLPCERGEHMGGLASSALHHGVFPASSAATPAAIRDVVGTLEADSLRIARDYLRQFPDQPLAAAADKLSTILSVRDRGLLVLYEIASSP